MSEPTIDCQHDWADVTTHTTKDEREFLCVICKMKRIDKRHPVRSIVSRDDGDGFKPIAEIRDPGFIEVQAQLTWTSAKPTQEGWYWAREQYHDGIWGDPICVRVLLRNRHLVVEVYEESEGGEGDSMKVFRHRDSLEICKFGEWAGPLQPPSKES
jgi:hypothetical protein